MKKEEKKARSTRDKLMTGHHYGVFILLFCVSILFISVYTFILQKNFSDHTLSAAVEQDIACSDAIHQLISSKLVREDFDYINVKGDMQSMRYQSLQKELNELRSLNSTRYLYTAKRNEEGRLVYLIDGLDLGAADFAYPGTYIEEEMIPYIEKALAGETVYSQEIIDTTWGHIFTACYPVTANDNSGDVIGALCIEMDMESAYASISASNRTSLVVAVVALLVVVVLIFCVHSSLYKRKIREKQQQKMLEETAAAAEAANKAKSTFLFNMSHDIRTPMNAIIGYAELADAHVQDPVKIRDYIEKIQICSKKMLSLLDNILELARIENNKTRIEETVCEVGETLDGCVIMIGDLVEKKKQKLIVEKDITYPYVYMDHSHVSEIVLNIISNAIKYTGENGTIRCSLRQEPYQDGWCMTEIRIADTGIGMSEEFRKHIFESFSRERSSTVSGIEGTGLGMGIVKNLVDLMHGTIEIESKQGEGSVFTVRIPCRIASREDAQPKRAQKHLNSSQREKVRILLAEDNDLNAEIAQVLLEEEGLLTERAKNGVACVEMLEKAEPDYYKLILMDIQMPIMDGYAATQKIRMLDDPKKANIPIIAMTTNAFAEDRERALQEGMNDHVAKPIDMNTLIPVLEKYL